MFKLIDIKLFLIASCIALQILPATKNPMLQKKENILTPLLYCGLGTLAGLAPAAWILSHPFTGQEPDKCPFTDEEKKLFTWELREKLTKETSKNKNESVKKLDLGQGLTDFRTGKVLQDSDTTKLKNWQEKDESYRTSSKGKLEYLNITRNKGLFNILAKKEFMFHQMITPLLRPSVSFILLRGILSILYDNYPDKQGKKLDQPLTKIVLLGAGLELASLVYLPLMFTLPALGRHNQIALSQKLFGKHLSGQLTFTYALLEILPIILGIGQALTTKKDDPTNITPQRKLNSLSRSSLLDTRSLTSHAQLA